MSDFEKVDLAAKALGFEVNRDAQNYPWRSDMPHEVFDPENNGEDCFELIVKLGISLEFYPEHDTVRALIQGNDGSVFEASAEMDEHGTRFAVLQVAAEVGKSK